MEQHKLRPVVLARPILAVVAAAAVHAILPELLDSCARVARALAPPSKQCHMVAFCSCYEDMLIRFHHKKLSSTKGERARERKEKKEIKP